MLLSELQKFDSTIQVIWHKSSDREVDTLSDLVLPIENSMVFVKNKNFYQEFLKLKEMGVLVHVLFEEKFFKSINELEDLKAWCLSVSVTSDLGPSMARLSKVFWDKKHAHTQDVIDGRQMGTAAVHPTALIAQGVFIGDQVQVGMNTKIHPGVVIMSGAVIGDDVEIFPNVTVYRDVKIGHRVRIHSGTVIGADGFGYQFVQGTHQKIWHFGSVIIENDVEIGSSSTVDGGTFSPTIIGAGTKIDNQVQIAHNCKIGKGVIICGSAGVAGSSSVGDYTVIGGYAAISNGLKIGRQVQIAGLSGVTSNLEDKAIVGGHPARDLKEWLRGQATLRKLSERKKEENT